MSERYPDPARRALITASTMLAAILVTLDATVANVALPRIQSSVAASPEQIVWVVTSYVIAGAIFTPLSGWLATRYGRKEVMVASVAGFTLSSIACGLATNLEMLVLFRLLQGASGAAMVPLSQATLLDINPPEKHGQAMALYGMGSMLGGIIGPALGGWLTDWLSWRAVFLINIPFGALACIGMFIFMSPSPKDSTSRFDLFGFAALSIFLASLQLMVDRGQQLDWFDSIEICIEATFMAAFGYVFLVHIFSAKSPFIRPALFRDRNFLIGSIISAVLGVLVFGAMPLIGIMLQQGLGYPVLLAGLVQAPRGIATMFSMIIAGRLMGKVDTRFLLLIGMVSTGIGFLMMSGLSLESHQNEIIASGIMLAIGSGMIFVPLSTIVFSTLDPALRNEGAALFALVRNIGSSVGISLLQIMTIRNAATVQSRLTEGVRPDNPAMDLTWPELDFTSSESLTGMHHEIARQAMMVGYIDSFWFLFVLSLILMPIIWLMRPPKRPANGA
ncbi:MAG: multidrug efflux MFS transporter [Novosphingobium sp.]|nr:multidrug efflux MFS transporter [Novosphingobium sp.]MCP5403590.1 multidrug efflux MFS transporter [Novosphingobium sp.]